MCGVCVAGRPVVAGSLITAAAGWGYDRPRIAVLVRPSLALASHRAAQPRCLFGIALPRLQADRRTEMSGLPSRPLTHAWTVVELSRSWFPPTWNYGRVALLPEARRG